MQIRNATYDQIQSAAFEVDDLYRRNLSVYIRESSRRRDGYRVHLMAIDKRGPGARYRARHRADGARTPTHHACWHAHGDFLDALFRIAPDAIVRTAIGGRTTRDSDWADDLLSTGFGTQALMSELCACVHRPAGRVDRRDREGVPA